MVQSINENNYNSVISQSDIVVIKFWADWCNPCKAMAQRFEELSETHANAEFYEMSVDENPDAASTLGIRSIPACIVFVKGERAETFVGSTAINELNSYLPTIQIEEEN